MKKISLPEFPVTVWVILIGTLLARVAYFMSWPYLTLILHHKFKVELHVIGIGLGLSTLLAALTGFYAGYLSDILGRQRLIYASLSVYALIFFGFASIRNPVLICAVVSMLGVARALYEPPSQALIADALSGQKSKFELAQTFQYAAINLGAILGPLAVLQAGIQATAVTFALTAVGFVVVLVLFLTFRNRLPEMGTRLQQKTKPSFFTVAATLRQDTPFAVFLLGASFFFTAFLAVESILPIHISEKLGTSDGPRVYGYLLIVNSLTCVVGPFILLHAYRSLGAFRSVQLSAIIMGIGIASFCYVDKSPWLIGCCSIIAFALGEVGFFPRLAVIAEQSAPNHLKGSYFGALSLIGLGGFLGPLVAGYLIELTNSDTTLISIASLCVVSTSVIGISKRLTERKNLWTHTGGSYADNS